MGIEENRQTVTIFFEQDKKVWKKVPFAECTKTGEGTLRPVWKAAKPVATCEGPSTNASSTKSAGSPQQVPAPAVTPTAPAVNDQAKVVEDILSSDEEEKEKDPYALNKPT